MRHSHVVDGESVHSDTTAPEWLLDVHRLRGVTILQILLLHAFAGGVFVINDVRAVRLRTGTEHSVYMWIADLIEIAFHDVTIYFVLISGILFSKVFAGRPVWSFYRSRVANVVLPYAVVTLALSTYSWIPGEHPRLHAWPPAEYVATATANFWSGTAEFHLWYIPVAAVLFTLSPLLHRAVTTHRMAPLATVFAAAPLLISRTSLDVTAAQVVYFAGPYVIGMLIGRDVPRARALIAAHVRSIAGVAAVASVALLTLRSSGIQRVGVTVFAESLFYIQKLALFAVLLHLAAQGSWRTGAALRRLLDRVAEDALALYLIHVTVLTPLLAAAVLWLGPVTSAGAWISATLGAGAVAALLSVVLVAAVRKLAPRWSRYLIGA